MGTQEKDLASKQNVIKRNGKEVNFDISKIANAIRKANKEVEPIYQMNEYQIEGIAENVASQCAKLERAVSVEEIQDMVETGIMRLASQKYDEEDGHALEAMLEQMKEIVHSGDNAVARFFAVDNEIHALISQLGKNPLAAKISRVVRTLTHAVRYETVSMMITSGRGDELVAAHSKLLEILRGHEGEDVEEIVRGTYFGDIIHGEEM